jgi:hypothetical protein
MKRCCCRTPLPDKPFQSGSLSIAKKLCDFPVNDYILQVFKAHT